MTLRSKPKRPYHPRSRLECQHVHFQNLGAKLTFAAEDIEVCYADKADLCTYGYCWRINYSQLKRCFCRIAADATRSVIRKCGLLDQDLAVATA